MKLKLSGLRKTCALVALASVLPVLAYAGKGDEKNSNGNGKDDQHENSHSDNKSNKGHHKPPVVPEANAVWVLIPFVGTVLLLSWRQLSRAKA